MFGKNNSIKIDIIHSILFIKSYTMQRVRICSNTSCSCAADTPGRCKYYGLHSFRVGTPFPDGTHFSDTSDLDITGKTYKPDPYMAPEVIQEIRAQRGQCKTTSTICISTVAVVAVGAAVALIR
jgi:hypothetical protein